MKMFILKNNIYINLSIKAFELYKYSFSKKKSPGDYCNSGGCIKLLKCLIKI